jgi:type VI secretion system protein ImpK
MSGKGGRSSRDASRGGRSARAGGGRGILETLAFEGPSRKAQPPARARMLDLCADWFSMVVALRQAGALADAAAIRTRALELKSKLEDDARRGGFSPADLEASVFALVGFLDETVLMATGPARDAWISKPLQLELYGAMLAGEQFFERLDAMRRDREARIEALEVYYACLAFGFGGKFKLSGPERIKALLVEVEADIAAVRGTGKKPLAPHAARHHEAGGAELVPGVPWWLAVAVFVLAVLLTWLLMKLFGVLGASADAGAMRRMLERTP